MQLPTYEQAADECRSNDKPSAIAWFITENEPTGVVDCAKFRREMEAVIDEAERLTAARVNAEHLREVAALELVHREHVHQLQMDAAFAKSEGRLNYWSQCALSFVSGIVATFLVIYLVAVLFAGAAP